MVKAMAFIKRKPGVSRDEFVRHYEEVHAPLALRCFPMFRKYVRNYYLDSVSGQEPDFDCVTEFWVDSMEDVRAVVDLMRSELGKLVRDDEKKFMDRAKTVSYLFEERASVLDS